MHGAEAVAEALRQRALAGSRASEQQHDGLVRMVRDGRVHAELGDGGRDRRMDRGRGAGGVQLGAHHGRAARDRVAIGARDRRAREQRLGDVDLVVAAVARKDEQRAAELAAHVGVGERTLRRRRLERVLPDELEHAHRVLGQLRANALADEGASGPVPALVALRAVQLEPRRLRAVVDRRQVRRDQPLAQLERRRVRLEGIVAVGHKVHAVDTKVLDRMLGDRDMVQMQRIERAKVHADRNVLLAARRRVRVVAVTTTTTTTATAATMSI